MYNFNFEKFIIQILLILNLTINVTRVGKHKLQKVH